MELTNRQWDLFDFANQQHHEQYQKYSREPYFTHLLRVAQTLSQYPLERMEIEIALCHDLLERTSCTKQQLLLKVKEIGYTLFPRNVIAKGVYDLTDTYTLQKYPYSSRTKRKLMESRRILGIESFSQTVKYAELIDNIPSIAKSDPEFAWVYLEETASYIGQLNEGNKHLYAECRKVLDSAINSLKV